PNIDPIGLKEMVIRTRRQGFSINDGLILREMAAVSVPIHEASGRIIAAISVAAIRSRMAPPRRNRIVRLLKRECASIECMLGASRRTAMKSQ
ncbi:MAG: IclR family transcriptional regulator domain-containing protein, partial [Casimicrobiaceae bacterium]